MLGVGTYSSGGRSFVYDGEWAHDTMHGKGLLKVSGGHRFDGSFADGRPGTGVLTTAGGPRELARRSAAHCACQLESLPIILPSLSSILLGCLHMLSFLAFCLSTFFPPSLDP